MCNGKEEDEEEQKELQLGLWELDDLINGLANRINNPTSVKRVRSRE